MELKDHIRSLLTDSFLEEMTAIRRQFHRHPELSFREHNTSETIRAYLDSWGIHYRFPIVETGILAEIRGAHPGPRVALRSDMDALPIQETSGVECSSEHPGVMHACGHDVHMSSLLGAIRILDRLKDRLEGELLFVFQPGEEKVPGGAKKMLEEGVFRDRRPDVIIAQHVLPDMDAGHVGFREGIYMASSDEIYLTVKGKGGHAALPEQIRNPVLMASHILISLQQEIYSRAPSGTPTVLSFGKVNADGAVNVIPDEVRMEGTFRTMNEAWRKKAHDLIGQISSGIASSMGGSCDLEIRHGYPVLHNDRKITRLARAKAEEFLGRERVEDLELRMTAEDFAWFAQEIPAVMYRLGVREPGQEQVYPLHTAGFRVDESALETGISLLAYLAVEMLHSK
jgi:amidohydrolase